VVEEGQIDDGISGICHGIAELRATGAGLMQTTFLALLSDAYRRAGNLQSAFGALDQALGSADRNSECVNQAELYRLKGELLLSVTLPDNLGAESCFRKALEIAGNQRTKSLELRTAIS